MTPFYILKVQTLENFLSKDKKITYSVYLSKITDHKEILKFLGQYFTATNISLIKNSELCLKYNPPKKTNRTGGFILDFGYAGFDFDVYTFKSENKDYVLYFSQEFLEDKLL